MEINKDYKILNDVLSLMPINSEWICISELKVEMFANDISRRGVNLELVLSKLYKDRYIEVEIRKSPYTYNTEKHYRISFDGNIFKSKGGYLMHNKKQSIETNLIEEVPENLKELLSIWHDKNDIENLISIYNNHKILFENKEPQKTLMSCFAQTLFVNGWLTVTTTNTHVSTVIAKKFFSLVGWSFNDKDKNLFDYHIELKNFSIQYTSKINIPKRESK